MSALPRLRRFRCQQSFYIAVADDQSSNLRAGLGYKLGAEMNIVAQVVNAELQPLEREERSETAQPWRDRFFLCMSETEYWDAWHGGGICPMAAPLD